MIAAVLQNRRMTEPSGVESSVGTLDIIKFNLEEGRLPKTFQRGIKLIKTVMEIHTANL